MPAVEAGAGRERRHGRLRTSVLRARLLPADGEQQRERRAEPKEECAPARPLND
jgi:hypothetical protein